MNIRSTPSQPVFSRQFGEGARQVLAIHCTIAHSGAWRGLAAAMAQDITVTAFDMLCHGRSPDWDGQGDFQDRNVEAAVPLLSEQMDLIGHSFGATVALRLALAFPEKVRSLTMIEPVFFAVALQDAPDLVAQHDAQAIPVRDALETGDHALAARLFNRLWSDGKTRWPDLPLETRAAMTRGVHVILACDAALYKDQAGVLAPGVLQGLDIPCLLIRGDQTHPVIGAVNDGLARRLPNAENVVVPGAGHMAPISHPRATAQHLRDLFDRVPV